MSLTTKKISLDFYNNNVTIINAKQSDSGRAFNITCTDYGRKVAINKSTTSAFVRYKKSDGNDVFNDVLILNDGTLNLNLTQQMLASTGKQSFDILIISASGLSSSDISDMDDINSAIISTMTLYINVCSSPIDEARVVSSSEYGALVNGMARLRLAESNITVLENTIRENEEARQSAESARQTNTANAINECNTATNNAETATTNANTATSNANTATGRANTATTNANNAATAANNAAQSANDAAEAANTAAELCDSVVDKTGIVLKTDIVNNLTTTTTGKVLDAKQGSALKGSVDSLRTDLTELQTNVSNLHAVHYSTTVNNSIGKDGDILMVPVS